MSIITDGLGDNLNSGIVVANPYPTGDDLQAFCLNAGIVLPSADLALDYNRTVKTVIRQWETDTNHKPFLPTTQTRTYDIPYNNYLDLHASLLSITSIELNGNPIAQYVLLPRNADQQDQPYTGIQLPWMLSRPHGYCTSTISITGTWGYSNAGCPDDVTQALLSLAAVYVLPTKTGMVGAQTKIQQDDVSIGFATIRAAASHYTAQQNQFLDVYNSTAQRYKKLVIV